MTTRLVHLESVAQDLWLAMDGLTGSINRLIGSPLPGEDPALVVKNILQVELQSSQPHLSDDDWEINALVLVDLYKPEDKA